MLTDHLLFTNGNETLGDTVSNANRLLQEAIYTCEINGTGGAPHVKVYGKLRQSDDATEDSGWTLVHDFGAYSASAPIVMSAKASTFPYLSVEVTSNGGNRDITVAVGYNAID